MTTLNEMLAELHLAVGDDSTDTDTVLTRGINTALYVASILFEPPELQANITANLAANVGNINVANEANQVICKVDSCWSANGSHLMGHMDWIFYQSMRPLMPANGSNSWPQFWSMRGNQVFMQPVPTANHSVQVDYLRFANLVSDANNTVELVDHHGFIIAFAAEYYWAFKEEPDSQQLWQRVADRLGIPFNKIAEARKFLRGSEYDNYVRRAIPQGNAPARSS